MATVQVTPLCGAYNQSDPLCYLLQVDDCNILLDCGWDPHHSPHLLEPLLKVLPTLDAILLSYPDLTHLGALPFIVSKAGTLPATCKVYATIPVFKMGQMFLYDAFLAREHHEGWNSFSLDDVDAAFDESRMITLRYAEPRRLHGRGSAITVTPLAAGHMVGGTIWKINKETEEIVYAVDFNHKTERHLGAAQLPPVVDLIHRPTHLITDAYNAMESHAVKRQDREENICNSVLGALRGGGKVLLPCDAAGRCLELLCILDNFWKANRLRAYHLVFLGEVTHSTLDNIKSLLEYCSEAANKDFTHKGVNLFNFAHVRTMTKCRELHTLVGPVAVVATGAYLESGASRELFTEWAGDAKNQIIFTDRGTSGTLQHSLIKDKLKTAEVRLWKELLLDGEELAAHYEMKEEAVVAAEAARVAKIASMQVDTDAADRELDAMDMDQVAAELEKEAGWSWEKTAPLMYGFSEPKLEWTEYGIQVDPAAFELSDEKMGTAPIRQMKDQMEEEEDLGPPSKWVCLNKTVEVAAKVEYIDLEGRADGISVKNIIKAIEPRQVLLIHGSPEATATLERFCSKLEHRPIVRAPRIEERVDMTSDLNMYKAKLSHSLMAQVQWAKCETRAGTYEVGYITGKMAAASAGDMDVDDSEKVDWSIEPVEMIAPRPLLRLGQLSLSDFKQKLSGANVHAEFRGTGKLATGKDGSISIKQAGRKDKSGKLSISGKLSTDYFAVREQLYKNYTIL